VEAVEAVAETPKVAAKESRTEDAAALRLDQSAVDKQRQVRIDHPFPAD
jgi:hypothetical protein